MSNIIISVCGAARRGSGSMNEAVMVDCMPAKGFSCSELGAAVTDMVYRAASISEGVESTANRSVRAGVINGLERVEFHLKRTMSNIAMPRRSAMAESLRDAQRDAINEDGYPLLPDSVVMRYDLELNCLTLARDSKLAPATNLDLQLLGAAERLVKKAMLLDLETKGMRMDVAEEQYVSGLLEYGMGSVRLSGLTLVRGAEKRWRVWGRRR